MVSVENFYGKESIAQRKIETLLKKNPIKPKIELPPYLTSLLGPSRTWKIFHKQQDAIECAKSRGSGLMSFAFEHSSGQRSFLVCHPVMLWFVQSRRPSNEKCTYEIIQEGHRCKLYLDIEFEYEYNPDSSYDSGERMLKTFLHLLKVFLREHLELESEDCDFLDLDSSSITKFSRHIIMNASNAAFVNNFAVGNIVKALWHIIDGELARGDSNEGQGLYGISKELLRELVVTDRKGQKKIFVDTSVYTRNRHFRTLGSTKLHKNTSLVVSNSNQYQPKHQTDYAMFLSSLITYFDNDDQKLLEFGPPTVEKVKFCRERFDGALAITSSTLDGFISQMVAPLGKIRRRSVSRKLVKFDIAGYRYCGNIGREHRSNNISLVVDLSRLFVYQTCYDPDCTGFQSTPTPLPPEVALSNDDDPLLLEVAGHTLSDNDLVEFMNGAENIEISFFGAPKPEDDEMEVFKREDKDDALLLAVPDYLCRGDLPAHSEERAVPAMNISDDQMMEIADSAECAWCHENLPLSGMDAESGT